ncbi:rod shape-determining protein MreD [Olivibacter domesticus]|uniref:Rod shape-determining protein MreD n=2 Tax=Olivibacter domesticus TaxID=407022 RepID=A0A1H7YK00_OLID1|nr:rod shape-determining protein MreD [Olivibacter domesticus]
MSRVLLFNIIRFIVLITMQVFLFKNMGYYNLATPFPYVLFLLMLPLGIPKWLLFLISFFTGLTVDVFYDTLGVNAAACVALAAIRTTFISITIQLENHETFATPSISEMSFRWFFIYNLVLVFVHHFVLFLLEAFTFNNLHYTLIRVILSCIFTILLILLFSLLFYRKSRR